MACAAVLLLPGMNAKALVSSGPVYSTHKIFAPGMTISQVNTNSSPTGEDENKVIDGNTSTKYLNFNTLNTGFTVNTGTSSIARSISITTANDYPDRDPVSYTLEGSNNGSTWSSITSGSLTCSATRFATQSFGFINTAAYSYYRVVFPSVCNTGTATAMQVSEVQLYQADEVYNTTSGYYYSTIQDGVNAAASGNTLMVAAGTFNESINISKSVKLYGAQYGVCAASRSGTESIINCTNGIGVNASNVTIDGFTIQGQTSSTTPGFGYAVYMKPNSTGTQLLNNIIQNNRVGSSLSNTGTNPTSVLVSCNLFATNNNSGSASGNGIYTDNGTAGGALSNVAIIGNTFSGNTNAGILMDMVNLASTASNISISSNIFSGDGSAVVLHYVSNSSFSSNVISGSAGSDCYVGGGVTNFNFNNNDLSHVTTGTAGIKITNAFGGNNSNITVNENRFTAYSGTVNAINVASGYPSGNLSATCNWFGTTNASTIASQISGSVIYTPYLASGIDNSTATGFQPVPNSCSGCPSGNTVQNTRTLQFFCSIQDAINDATTIAGDNIMLSAGTFNEQVSVTKSVKIKGSGTQQSIIDFTGTVSGKPSLFDISTSGVTIENLKLQVDLTKLGSAIIASGSNLSNLTIKDNTITPYGSSAAASSSYSNRNAISINYGSYRTGGSGGVNNVSVTGNTVAGVASDAFSVARYFRSAVSMDEAGGTISGNTFQSINHDVLARFGSNGAITVSGNNFNGGGVELAEMNSGAGPLTVSGNTFDATFANLASPNTAVLRFKNANNTTVTNVSGNTFNNHEWAVSLENYNNATLDNNTFTPLAGSTTYRHVTFNTKTISGTSSSSLSLATGATLTNNVFNGNAAAGGTALSFFNHSTSSTMGTYTIGTTGNENSFQPAIGTFVYLDGQSGSSTTSTFPPYNSLIGTGSGAITTMAPWSGNVNVENNKFDAGSGLKLASALSATELFAVEDKITHKLDNSALGFVTVRANNDFVTTNSGSIQRGIDAASSGFTVNVNSGTYNEAVLVNKSVSILGAQRNVLAKGRSGSESIVDPNVSAAHGFKVVTDNVAINGFTITNSAAYPSSERYGVVTIDKTSSGQFTGITVKNNVISRQSKAVDFNYTDNYEISGNWLHGENDPYNYGCIWIDDYGTSSSNGLITNNDLDGYGSVVEIQGDLTHPVSNTTISLNRSTGGQYVLFGLQNSSVTKNSVLNVTVGSHVFVGGGCTNTTFTENFFDGGSYNGVRVSNNFGAGLNSGLTFNSNSITGHNNAGYYEINVTPSAYSGTLSATCNWFGSNIPATVAAKISGPVTYVPYLSNGTDADANQATGFQPTASCSGSCPTVTAAAAVTPLYPMSGQKIQTIFLNYPSSAQSETINVTPAGGSGGYSYVWTMSGCNTTTPNSSFSNTGSSYTFTPASMTGSGLCGAAGGDNIYTFTIKVSDGQGCPAAATLTKRLNVVNPYSGTNVMVCHKVIVGRGYAYQVVTVNQSTAANYIAQGDQLGNCNPFTGRTSAPGSNANAGEEPVGAAAVWVYPNPSTGAFSVALSAIENEAEVIVTDVQGKLIARQTIAKDAPQAKASFDLSNVARGVYLVQVKDGSLNYRTKIVVQ